jgi:histidinol-phosphate/aromatic aminotransferase/cobyric acid decarboxylase-like protein
MASARTGWTTVAVSADTVDAIRKKIPNVNVSSFAREAIEEKLDRIELQKESLIVKMQKPDRARKVATLSKPSSTRPGASTK